MPSGWGRRRRPSRRRSLPGTPTCSPGTSWRRLHEAESAAAGDEQEQLYRLRKVCEGGIVSAELVEREDELENRQLAARLVFRDEELPLRTAQARLAVLHDYADREELGELLADLNATFNEDRLELARAGEELSADLSGEPDPVARNEEEKAISLRTLSSALSERQRRPSRPTCACGRAGSSAVLGPDRDDEPRSYHMAYVRRLSPLESTYTKERATDICLATLKELGFDLAGDPNIKPDLDDRPQKAPRACVIASDPPTVVHLITRAQGGLHDYQAFLHEAGHALHYAGCDPVAAVHVPPALARSRADRDLLVHRRGDLARARLARAPLRPLRRGGDAERRGDDVSRSAPVSTLHGEARLRARVLESFPRGRRDARGLRGEADRRHGRPLPLGRVHLGHGRGLLLGRLPAGLDPLVAAAREAGRGRTGRTGGAAPTRAIACGRCSSRVRGLPARRSPRGSVSIRSTPDRFCTSWARRRKPPAGGEVRRHAGEEPDRGHAGRRQGRPGAGQGAPRG